MSIFQKSVINNHLSQLDKAQVEQAFARFNENYSFSKITEIEKMKEEEYQDGFLRDIFVEVLGYTLKPAENYDLAREFKNQSDGKKADGAILKDENAVAVIELKSTKTKDLTKVTQQAFNYKNNQPACKYVITSNFQKLRFYIDYANEYEEFDLFNLKKDDFELLYLLLRKDSILTDLPLKLKTETKFHEEKITDKLYKDYSSFKYKIYDNLVKNNSQYDKLTLFKKSQKFLDRLLFVFFAEDTGLVPPNAISKIVEQWQLFIDNDEYFSLYSRFVKFFSHLNQGHQYKTYDLPAYNGGLFAPDEILDNISIDDEVLKDDALLLSAYDFSTEVDVNILGHIFEHSLNEIESIRANVEEHAGARKHSSAQEHAIARKHASAQDGIPLPNKREHAPSTTSKRKKNGVFYTPKYITQYIVENTIGKLCTEKRQELGILEIEFDKSIVNKTGKISAKGRKLFETLQAYKEWLFDLKIVDPACGSGAFLNQALNFLIKEHQQIDDIIAELTGEKLRLFDTDKTILEKNLFGVDINEESVEIAKLSLWLRTAQKGRKLSKLNNNIKCGNSLIDDPKVAGEKAFNWHTEFPNVFKKKNKKAWHVTTATHYSRYSKRMFENHVKKGDPVWLSEKEEVIVTETIAEIVEKDKLNMLAYNICGDHTHFILACTEEELPKIVQKIKSMSARACNIAMGRTVPKVGEGEHANAHRGKTQFHLWAEKFQGKEITSNEQLENTIAYIHNNRKKHQLPENTAVEKLATAMCCTHQHAFRTEYDGGFDVVIGNPPYVRAELLSDFREYFQSNFNVYHPAGDLFSYFYEKSFKILKPKIGLFGFISNTFDKTTAGITIREYLQSEVQFLKYIDFTEVQIFEGATTYPVIIIAQNQKGIEKSFSYIKIPKTSQSSVIDIDFHESVSVSQSSLNKGNWSFKSNRAVQLIEKLKLNKTIKLVYGKCNRGIVTGFNEAFIVDLKFKKEIENRNNHDAEIIKTLFEGKDLEKWCIPEIDKQIIFLRRGIDIDQFPLIKEHLEKYRMQLTPRTSSEQVIGRKPGRYKWFEIQDSVDYYKNFEKPKIVFPNLQNSNKFAYDKTGAYINAPAVILPTEDEFLTAILNSKLVWYFLINICVVRNGGYIEVKPQYFEQIPIPELSSQGKTSLLNLTVRNIESTKALQEKSTRFLNRIKSNFEIEKISTKLEKFYDYDFKTFVAELKKQKVKLSLVQQDEWEEYFNAYKTEINSLQSQISACDKEIDQMVYELYGLTDEEIAIVENSIQ